jgi:hypothetical protein
MFPYIIEPLHNCVKQKYQSLLSLCATYGMKVVLLVYAIYLGLNIANILIHKHNVGHVHQLI